VAFCVCMCVFFACVCVCLCGCCLCVRAGRRQNFIQEEQNDVCDRYDGMWLSVLRGRGQSRKKKAAGDAGSCINSCVYVCVCVCLCV
jgi:hypothetical protein